MKSFGIFGECLFKVEKTFNITQGIQQMYFNVLMHLLFYETQIRTVNWSGSNSQKSLVAISI